MTSIQVSVDGHNVDPVTFDFLFQEDPFPAGHVYEVVLPAAIAISQLATTDQPLSRREAMQVFSALDRLKTNEGLTPFTLEWFFNSVESIDLTETGWIIRGACSPVIASAEA